MSSVISKKLNKSDELSKSKASGKSSSKVQNNKIEKTNKSSSKVHNKTSETTSKPNKSKNNRKNAPKKSLQNMKQSKSKKRTDYDESPTESYESSDDSDKSDKSDESDKIEELDDDEENSNEYDEESTSDKSDDEDGSEEDDEDGSGSGEKMNAPMEIITDVRETEKSERIIITGKKRVMQDRMSLPELTSIVCARIQQIENGSPVFVDITSLGNPKDIAIEELRQGTCPIKIIRHHHGNKYEVWHVHEMIIPWSASGCLKK